MTPCSWDPLISLTVIIPHHAWETLLKKAPGRKVYAGDVEESSRYRELILGTPPATRRCWHTLNSSGQYLPLSSTNNLASSLSMMLFYDSFGATVTSPVLFVPLSCHLNFYWRFFYYRLRNWPASLHNPLSHTPNPPLEILRELTFLLLHRDHWE
jgi:hypothetical protein